MKKKIYQMQKLSGIAMVGFSMVITALALLSLVANAQAVESSKIQPRRSVTLQEVWRQVHSNSAVSQASVYQVESAREGLARTSRHWLPRVYLDAKSFNSNDPATSFMGLLEQRSLTTADFDPSKINRPSAEWYSRGALGLDLPLYEGGAKSAQSEMQQHLVRASENESSQVKMQVFAESAKSFGSLGVLRAQKQKLVELSSYIYKLLGTYRLGSKANPMGYSGLLGLKAMANRMAGLEQNMEAQKRSHYSALREMGFSNPNWEPDFKGTVAYVEQQIQSLIKTQATENESFKVRAVREQAKVGNQVAEMEKARFLPRVGLFAETYVYNGPRKTDDGYAGGLYLQWNLFNPADYGAMKESRLKSFAAQKQAEAIDQQERAERVALAENLVSLKENIRLLAESELMLREQTQVGEGLFRNGSMNALQFVEILGRRVDLLASQNEIELALISTATRLAMLQSFDPIGFPSDEAATPAIDRKGK